MSKAARQRSARERLAEERRRQAQKQQRTRRLMISLSGLVVVALAVVITVYFVNKKDPSAYSGALAPTSRQSDGAILAAKPGVKAPKLELFEDFQCPICHEFENASGSTIKRLAAEGKVNVLYYPFWLFKQQPEPIRGNSQRAANAALCAPADKWIQYHDAIYKHQPAEGSKGFSNKDLIGWAKDLGFATPQFQQCVNGNQKQSQIDQMTNYAEQTRKVTGTPTVFLNGQSLDLNSTLLNAKNLEKAILAATPADVTPSASPTAPASPSATPKK
ncbi:thioredoxin domain-containing protein [Actinomadura sp. DC4]|uniref:DsbA family protein n=1 Tax=Actinomadura sp. DC4 TaxID=3055069 RepID=UPI0025B17340|nr:thioredoxin domain-containing protein [Actinomadura sp. DC4]MDN3351038.1 thioredoxin domain-containing protein [Actinomadura sp. DC4]